MPDTVEKTTRVTSPILLALAALCFLLPFVAVSCNTGAGGAALGTALGNLGSSGAGASAGDTATAEACLAALSGRDLATYSGLNMVTGSNPSTPSNIPGCPNSASATATTADQGGIGVQPLLVAALILIAVGLLATPLRGRLRGFVAGGAALLAAILIIVNNSSVHSTILDKLSSSGGSSSLSSLGINGGLDTFFNIHAAIGFWLVLVALLAALGVNATAALAAARPRLAADGGAPPPGSPPGPPAPNWPPPGAPPGPTPPVSP